MMNIDIIIDNNSSREDLVCEEGFCSYILCDGLKILFDTGRAGGLLANAKNMSIDLLDLDYIVLSHGHYDHINGMQELICFYNENNVPMQKRPKIITHTNSFLRRFVGERCLSFKGSYKDIEDNFEIIFTNEPYFLSENLCFLGQIPRNNDFENKENLGEIEINGKFIPDFILDDSGLCYKKSGQYENSSNNSETSLIVIMGCSHSGICNVVDYVRAIFKVEKIESIIGGFHLKNSDENFILKTINELEKRNINKISACHCTGKLAGTLFKNSNSIIQTDIACGTKLEF